MFSKVLWLGLLKWQAQGSGDMVGQNVHPVVAKKIREANVAKKSRQLLGRGPGLLHSRPSTGSEIRVCYEFP